MTYRWLLFGVLPLLLAACGSRDDWPNLSDKMPDPAERERVFERAEPSATDRAPDPAPTSESDALALVADVARALAQERALYAETRAALEAADETGRRQAWLDAQFALTRLSITLSRLTQVRLIERDDSVARSEAQSLWDELDPYIAAERQALTRLEPQQ